jgi:hypothetical protein
MKTGARAFVEAALYALGIVRAYLPARDLRFRASFIREPSGRGRGLGLGNTLRRRERRKPESQANCQR